jgi:hypothetical protein
MPSLYHAIGRGSTFEKHPNDFEYPQEPMKKVLVKAQVSSTWGFSFIDNNQVMDAKLIVFAYDNFSLLQSTLHYIWAKLFATSMKNDMSYTPSNVFETFPFPEVLSANTSLRDCSHPFVEKLENLGEEYHTLRSRMMIELDIGLTKLYNAFHSPKEIRDDFIQLRELHRLIDEAVKEAYGWSDLELGHDFHEVPYLPANDRVRYTISESARLEILRRLYKLNQERYEAEVAEGLWDKKKPKAVKTTVKKKQDAQPGLF